MYKICEDNKMKLSPANIFSICVIFTVAFSACSSTRKTDSVSSSIENKTINSPWETPRIADDSANVADQNFVKEWKAKYDMALAELERNRQLWQESKIVDYDFVIAKYAGGMTNTWNRQPVVIKIRGGEEISLEKASKEYDYVYDSRTDGFEDFDTIDKLFSYLRQELDDRNIIEAEYDRKYGYPKKVFITFTFASNHNWHTIDVSKFKVIK